MPPQPGARPTALGVSTSRVSPDTFAARFPARRQRGPEHGLPMLCERDPGSWERDCRLAACSTGRTDVRDREHPRETLGRAPVAGNGQAPVTLGLGHWLAAASDRTQRGDVRAESHGGLLGTGTDNVDGAAGDRQPVPVAVDPQRERAVGSGSRIKTGLERNEQRTDAQLAGCPHRLLAPPAAQFEEDRLKRAAAGGELIDRDTGGRGPHGPAHDARLLEVAQPLREDIRTDSVQAIAHLEESLRSEDQLAYD